MATAGDGRSSGVGGRIHRLEVENFKSYKGMHTIGPFFDFTAIIGPNGAGKSNLMDAISFVLGVRSVQLRTRAQLKDLIYALDDRDKEAKGRRAYVRLVYQMGADELHFTRTITDAGGSEYRIDGRAVNWEDYNAKLRSLGILVKARNFLVFQGVVESIASKNPKELTALLEQISGSDELRREYDELEELKARVVMERKQKKAQKEEAEKHMRLQQELKLLKTEHYLWQLYTIGKDKEKLEADLAEDRQSLQQVQEKNQSADYELAAKKKEQSGFLKKMTLCEKMMAKKKLELDKKQPVLLKLEEQISQLKSKIKSYKKEIDKKKDDNNKHLEEMKRLQSALVDVTRPIEELNEQGQDKTGKMQLTDDQLQEYHRIKEDTGMKTAKLRDEKEVIDKKLNADVEAKRNLEENMQQLRSREDEISAQEHELNTRLNKLLSIPKHEDDLKYLRDEHNRIAKEQQSSGSKYQTLKQRLDEIDTQLWELKADKHETLKKRKNQLESEMSDLGSPRELQRKELAVSEKITGLEKKLHYLHVEQNNLREKLLKLSSERSNIEKEIDRLEPGKEELETRIAEKEVEVRKLEKKINEIVDKVYRDFSISVGMKNICEYEERQLKDAQALQERKLSLSNQMPKLKYQLEYEQKRDMNTPIVKLKERHESLEKELKGVQEKETGAKVEAEQILNQMDELKAEAEDWKSKSDECDKVIDELKEQNASVAAKLAKLDRQVKSKEGQLMQLISLQREISEKCELEQLKLPTVNDPMDTGSSSQELVLDYSQLSEIYLHDMQPSERDKHEVEFKQKIGSYVAEIERTAPNLKALDQYDALQRKEKEVTEKFETARKEEKEISDKYNSVKQKRYELFMKAFDHISKGIDKIYKQLTESHTHPLGGTAYFNLENEDEPFLHGIEYRVMPPTKRFRDMKQLSGGEKTVAALALLFAIHSFRPSPFFILDEVDAPLDYQPLHKPTGDDKGNAAAAAEKGEGAAGHAPRGLPDDIARRVVKQASPFEMNGRLHVERGGPKFIETLVEGCEVRAGIFHDTPFEEHSPHAPPLPPSPSMLEEGTHISNTRDAHIFALQRDTSFEEALHMAKKRKTHWPDEATEVFFDICVKRIESMPPLNPGSWIGNPIITDIAIMLFCRTQKAYSNEQLFNKWKNFHKTRDKHCEVLMELKATTYKKASNTCESTSTGSTSTAIPTGIEVNTRQPPLVFKSELYKLTGVPPEHQKIIGQNGILKDDDDWSTLGVTHGQKLMMIGRADEILKVMERDQGNSMVLAAANNSATRDLSKSFHLPTLQFVNEYETHAEVLCKENQQFRLQLAAEREQKKMLVDKVANMEKQLAVEREQKKMLVDKVANMEKQLFNADVIRRALHNQMMELKGSIRVFCRVRPMLTQNANANKAKISYPQKGEYIGRCVTVEQPEGKIHFTCDRVFNHKASQEEIFVEISELVQSALDGRKVNIFAYGQTGSGKTYTMLGEKEDAKGVIPRAIEKIFESIHLRESHGSVNIVKVSMIEIYNNENRSLNTPKSVVKTAKEALEAFEEALKKRSVAKTRLNDKSSRSHFIFKLFVYSTNKEKQMKTSEGVLNIIDLAGSERYESEANEDLRKEATAINDSLLHLGVMLAAIENGSYISSRNCKLTTELADSLGKDSKTLMFVNVASEEACVAETKSTFDFASAHIKSCNKTWEHISLKERTALKEKRVGFQSPGIPSARPRKDVASSVIESPYSMLNKTAQRQGQGPSCWLNKTAQRQGQGPSNRK